MVARVATFNSLPVDLDPPRSFSLGAQSNERGCPLVCLAGPRLH